jgi:hypothetical protein
MPEYPASAAAPGPWILVGTGVGFQNSWADSGFGDPCAYRLLRLVNEVEIKGDLSVPTFSSDSTIFTLPTGFKPSASQWFDLAIKTSTGTALVTTSNLQVTQTGVVKAIFNSVPGASTGLTTRAFFNIFVSLDF